MTLYGLDIIISKDGRRFVNEINGIQSGMQGFQNIYGDNRVKEKVVDMLQAKYGELSVNDGTFRITKFKREHSFKYALQSILFKTPILKRILLLRNLTLFSKKAEIEWLSNEVTNPKPIKFPFDFYEGQDSTVINIYNEKLSHPTVNPFVAEAISRNKFLQYLLLANSTISDTLIKSSLVGLGAANQQELEKMLLKNDTFVVKPILGSCGRGIKFLTKEEVEQKYMNSRGPIDSVNPLEPVLALIGKKSKIKYIEDLISEENYSFEPGVSIIQPFIDSKHRGAYSVIRAILCNGKFVDAYKRMSSDKRVNLSQNARASSFEYDGDFTSFCEKTVKVFENKSKEYFVNDYKRKLYGMYIKNRV